MTISLKTIMNKDGYNKNAKLLAREVYYSITHPNTTTANGVPRNRARYWSSALLFVIYSYTPPPFTLTYKSLYKSIQI